jgi:hypothetical protein
LGIVDIVVGGEEIFFGTLIGFTGVGVPATIVLYTSAAVDFAVGVQEEVEGVKSILGAYSPDTNPQIPYNYNPYVPPAPESTGHVIPIVGQKIF